jgi:hypothetical protein
LPEFIGFIEGAHTRVDLDCAVTQKAFNDCPANSPIRSGDQTDAIFYFIHNTNPIEISL